jgi:hypothetical protein
MSIRTRKIWEAAFGSIPPGMEVDHINCDDEDDSLCNLRLCTHEENTRNRRKWTQDRSKKKSKYKGVYWCKKRKGWISQIRFKGKTKYLGQFDNEYTAHLVWCETAKELYGEFFRAA